MTLLIARIALIIQLSLPVLSIVCAWAPIDREWAAKVFAMTVPVDMEDADDTNAAEDTDTDSMRETIPAEKFAFVRANPEARKESSLRAQLFNEHHLEVSTPPPKG